MKHEAPGVSASDKQKALFSKASFLEKLKELISAFKRKKIVGKYMNQLKLIFGS